MTEISPRAPSRFPALAALGWAAFLACSWTWCIGMFLPALLMRDYGVWAWVVFALPNVVGAAAMGWVLQRPGASERLVSHHSGAMAAFSIVTILFHVLFVGWVVLWLGGTAFVLVAAGAAVVCFPLLLSRRVALVLSPLLVGGSIAAFVVSVLHSNRLSVPAGTASMDLLPLAVVCLLGFGLCPYLDLTFHRARQATGVYGAIAAFTIGFGALFLAMIVFTLWYGPFVLPPGSARGSSPALPAIVTMAIAGHMAGQSGFTVAAHGVEIARRLRTGLRQVRWGLLLGMLFAGGVLAATWYLREKGGYANFSGEEVGYRLFMAFYGLIAPAYVWIVLMPLPNARSSERQRWIAFIVAVILAAPAYWLGFIEQRMMWLMAGVGVIVLARLIVEGTNPTGDRT